jgi:death on curing protein
VNAPRWLSVVEVVRLHEIQIHRYGGQTGIRDPALLESAVSRPKNLYYYERMKDPADLVAAYAFSLCRNHPFIDGNKRTAFFAMAVFLELNGLSLRAPQGEATQVMLSVAAAQLTEIQLCALVRKSAV